MIILLNIRTWDNLINSEIIKSFRTTRIHLQKDGFFYFTGLKAKQVAREGLSGEIQIV
jgi:hypothetical protein